MNAERSECFGGTLRIDGCRTGEGRKGAKSALSSNDNNRDPGRP